jgi:hypothetical protein
MEGSLELYGGLLSGYKKHFVTLFNNTVIISTEKGGEVKGKIHLDSAQIDPKSEGDTKFTLSTGFTTLELNAADLRDKIRWMNAL